MKGVLIDEKQLRKLVEQGKTDLIEGFKPTEKGKKPFSAYLVLDKENQQIRFEFPTYENKKEISNYLCPSCRNQKLYKNIYGYTCDCGFKLYSIISEKEIPEEQIRKLIVKGESDIISGFYSARMRKRFSAKLKINGNKVEFVFPENDT